EGGGSSTSQRFGSITTALEYWVARSSRAMTVVRGMADDDSCVYAAFLFASSIARQTRSGVSGMSMWVMPYSDSASITALTMVERLPAQPASPQPLVPNGLDLAGTG